jgi:hypothetical protein
LAQQATQHWQPRKEGGHACSSRGTAGEGGGTRGEGVPQEQHP